MASFFTKFCIPSGQARRTVSARTRNSSRSPIPALSSQITFAAPSKPPCLFARASPCLNAISLSKRLASSTSSPSGFSYERARVPFTVLETEQKASVSVASLPLRLRLDRIDRLIDNSLLVIDYKSGDVSPNSWDLPRPDDVQLPLYANFALHRDANEIGGLVFAKVRTGEPDFAGRVRDAKATLLANLRGTTNLVKKPLTTEQLSEWQEYIEELALDFLAGRAVVNPRDYPKTCERCGLQALCRISGESAATR